MALETLKGIKTIDGFNVVVMTEYMHRAQLAAVASGLVTSKILNKERVMKCRDCGFVDEKDMCDKCPDCHNDDWIEIPKGDYSIKRSTLNNLIKKSNGDIGLLKELLKGYFE